MLAEHLSRHERAAIGPKGLCRMRNQGVEFGWRALSETTENPCQMALVAKAALGGHFSEVALRTRKLLAGIANAQALQILARSLIQQAAEDTGQVNGMHSCFGGDFGDRQVASKLAVQQLQNAIPPCRRFASPV